MTLVGDWDKFQRQISTLEQRLEKAIMTETGKIAKAFEKAWVQGIKRNDFGLAPNAPLTKAVKKSSKPLVDHGDLINSIKAQRMQNNVWFVGIHKNAKRRDDSGGYQMALISIAEIMEYGTRGPIKPKGHPFLSIPLTRDASRAGSPRKYPGKLTPIIARNGSHGVLIDEKADSQFLLVKMMPVIKPRPAMRKAYERFAPIAQKMWADAVSKEVYRDVA